LGGRVKAAGGWRGGVGETVVVTPFDGFTLCCWGLQHGLGTGPGQIRGTGARNRLGVERSYRFSALMGPFRGQGGSRERRRAGFEKDTRLAVG